MIRFPRDGNRTHIVLDSGGFRPRLCFDEVRHGNGRQDGNDRYNNQELD
jgi:hypothetical protein